MWVSGDLNISNACVMPFGYGVGDHRAFVLDIPLESMIGIDPVKIVRPVGRRLNSKLPGCAKHTPTALNPTLHGTVSWNACMMHTQARIPMQSEHGKSF
jgi:hypothetical protein